jgi:hypothetical protein
VYTDAADAPPRAWAAPGEPGPDGVYGCAPLCNAAALALPPAAADAFDLVWPLRGGRFAVRADQPLSVVRAALEASWRAALRDSLCLDDAAIRACSAVLVAPLTLGAREVRELAALLLCRLGFKSLAVHAESSAAAFAAGAPLVCVVLAGAHTAAVTCCEEGVEVPGSRLVLPLGGDDATDALPWLAARSSGAPWPLPRCSPRTSPADAEAMRQLLRQAARAPADGAQPARHDADAVTLVSPAHADGPGAPPRRFAFRLGDAASLAPLGFFAPRVLGAPRHAATARAHRAASAGLGADGADTDDPLQEMLAAFEAPRDDAAADAIGLDTAVMASIAAASAGRPDVRTRLQASILLAGGAAATPGLADALRQRCAARLPAAERAAATVAAVVALPDPRLCAWRGGALLGAADSAREGWVRREAMEEGVAVGRPGRYDMAASLLAQLQTFAQQFSLTTS